MSINTIACNQHTLQGSLEVICGPMFSGKSEELIRRIRRAQIAKQNVITFKPHIDTRYGLECIVSHNGATIATQAVTDVNHIIPCVQKNNAHVIGIDEAQFFSNELIPIVCTLVHDNKRVIIAGLDTDFRRMPFGPIAPLLAIADKVTKLQAICTLCGHDASCTQRLVNGQPAKHNDPIIMIGAQQAYQARCRSCFIIDKS